MAVEDYLPLMGMAAGLLGGQQPGQRPNFASSLGSGLLGGLQGYQMAQGLGDDRKQRRLQELRLGLEAARAQKQALQEAQQQMAFATATKGMDPQKAALLQAGGPQAMSAYVANEFAAPKPPTSRTINMGGQEITQEWTPDTGWQEVARGSRWAPQQAPAMDLVAVMTPDGPKYVPESQAAGMMPYDDRHQTPSPIAKLIAERDALPEGDPRRAVYDAAIANDTAPKQGIRIGADGTVQIGGTADPVLQREGVKKDRESDLAFKTADDALANLADRIQNKGMAILPGAEQQETSTIYRLTINELRKLTESGALQKADLDYLESIIQDPTSLSAAPQAAGNFLGTGSAVTGTLAQIAEARKYLANTRQRTGEVYNPSTAGAAAPQQAPAAPYQSMVGPNGPTGDMPPELLTQPGTNTPSGAQAAGIPQIKDDNDYNALPSGATFIAPDGSTRRKP
jgi:hypothetical protein